MDVHQLWTTMLGELELEVSRAHFASFFRGTALDISQKNGVVIQCPNAYSLHMLQTRFAHLIKTRLEERFQRPLSIRYDLLAQDQQKVDAGPLFSASQPSLETVVRKNSLNPQYVFNSFAVSESNQMAFAAAQAVSTKPSKAYNPLFLWGSVGVGKTHLMQALGIALLSKHADYRVIYCTGEEFTNGIIEAIKERSSAQFKRKFRTAQLLMVDDVQFIAGKESVQTEFFHTFNSILQAGGQIVLTSDKPPADINMLEARLRSRFEGGLTIDIQPPNFELRTAILLIKARERGITIPIDDAKQLAAAIEDNRALEGALLRYFSETEQGGTSVGVVNKVLSGGAAGIQGGKKNTKPLHVLEILASHFDLKPSHLTSPSRKQLFAEPRQLLMFILRQDLGLEYAVIGSLLGGRDHSTIIHGVDKISNSLPKKEHLRLHLAQIRRLLWG